MEPAHIPSCLTKAWAATAQRKSYMIQRKIDVEKCPKGKREGLLLLLLMLFGVEYKLLEGTL